MKIAAMALPAQPASCRHAFKLIIARLRLDVTWLTAELTLLQQQQQQQRQQRRRRRQWKWHRNGFCDNTIPTISDIFSNANDSLFKTMLKNSYHVLYPYLPESHCHRHNKALIPKTLSVYRSRFEALPSTGPAFFAEQMVKRSNNSTENGHIYARGFAEDCYFRAVD